MFQSQIKIPGIPTFKLLTHDPQQDLVSAHIHQHHHWEIHETDILADILKPGFTFVDVGANIGYYSVLAAQQVGQNGCVISFEPNTNNYHLLENNLTLNKCSQARPIQAGLGAEAQHKTLFYSQDNMGDHRLFAHDGPANSQQQSSTSNEQESVKIVQGDEYLQTNGINTVHCIKIDTQGYEYPIVLGLENTIRNNAKHLHMIIEFWPWGLRQNGYSAEKLLQLLKSFDMGIHVLDHLQGGIYSSELHDLQTWLENTEADIHNEGFVNLLLTPAP